MPTTLIETGALLNLGCGSHHHPAWTNLDVAPVDASIRRFDVTRPLPFADASFDAVYHSHLLEHLPQEDAFPCLRECCRVLRPGGVMRVVVPDLEAMARLYLDALDDAAGGDPGAIERHRWLVMEMYDQTVRESPGGAMPAFLHEKTCDLAWHRLGRDGTSLKQSPAAPTRSPTWRDRLRGWIFGSWRERLVRWLLGAEYPLLAIGRFRRSGEVHQWMYDRVSLGALVTEAGFENFRVVGADESAIPRFNEYHLDVNADGQVCKPDSLFAEADKP